MVASRLRRPYSCTALSTVLLLAIFFPRSARGWFRQTGQEADILLSGIDFNNPGYLIAPGDGLLFNHPMNCAVDGTYFLLADTRNNRVLIWDGIPAGNTSPGLVLGQDGLTTNAPGTGLNRFNWPVGVTAAGGKVVVADTYNERLLIWNTFPAWSGQSADISIVLHEPGYLSNLEWPWDVWTDGTVLVATATPLSTVLIWNSFPSFNNQSADLYLRAKSPDDGQDKFGTPRTIGTDGRYYLVVGDHNPQGQSSPTGDFFWNSFPSTENQAYDFFMANPQDGNQLMWGGIETQSGKFVTVASPGIDIWDAVPSSQSDPVDLFVGADGPDGYNFNSGDGSDLVETDSGNLLISLYNSNMVVGFDSLPAHQTDVPDFAVGAPDIGTNTLDTYYIVTNGVPATDGSRLFVSSDFDRKLYVWGTVPAASGTHPDLVYEFDFAPWDNALWGNNFALGGREEVALWTTLPLTGNDPDYTFQTGIGSVTFQDVMGVAIDDYYFYVSDNVADRVYVWEGLPEEESEPAFWLGLTSPERLSSDGYYLTVVLTADDVVQIYDVAGLSGSSVPRAQIADLGVFDQDVPGGALAADGHLFIVDTQNYRVFGWKSISDAIVGGNPDCMLGNPDTSFTAPAIGADSLFWPATLAFADRRLWVGEFKFSGRLLGYEAEPSPTPVGFHTPTPSPSVTPTPEGFHTPTPTPEPTATAVTTPAPTPSPSPILAPTATPKPPQRLVVDWDDYNGDGTTDYALYRPYDGTWRIEGVTSGAPWGGSPEDVPAPGDYDGDGIADLAYFRAGAWFILGVTEGVSWGAPGDVPVPGDYNGDGTSDLATWRPSDGRWSVLGETGTVPWGCDGDIPVPGDYNGDGTADKAVWRPSNGMWCVLTGPGASSYVRYGLGPDIPVPMDYNGDGTTDCAIWRGARGLWAIRGLGSFSWGLNSAIDQPFCGDFDGDGARDAVIWRAGTGRWFVYYGPGNADRNRYGTPDDRPAIGASY